MKKLLPLLLFFLPFNLLSQIINKAEFFWDTDPGVGLGNLRSLHGPSDSLNFSLSINTTGLIAGNHVLYIRTRDSFGTWSLSEAKEVAITPTIISAEYFWDTDPGTGLGSTLTVTGTLDDSVNFSQGISTNGLSPGIHYIYVRTKDNSGKWSLSEVSPVNVTPVIIASEYFWDNDPGPGLGSSLTVTGAPDDSVNFSQNILTTGLSAGIHYLYTRTKDNSGKWSLSEVSPVTVNPNIVAAEYFWDTDPGINSGTSLTITGTPGDSLNLTRNISSVGLTAGPHYLYVRTKSNSGYWSLSEGRVVTVNPSIIAAEYFVDTDPGAGSANAVAVTGTLDDSVNFSFSLPTSSLSPGIHYVYMRTKDKTGKWSLSEPRQIFIGSCTSSILASGPTTACFPETVNLTASPGISYLWSTGATTSSLVVSTSGNYSCVIMNSAGCSSVSNTIAVTVNPQLNLKLFIEGFYLGDGKMNASIDPSVEPFLCDTITIRLAAAASPHAILNSAIGVLRTDGTLAINFPSLNSHLLYYIVLKHRNAIETWSAAPVDFSSCPTSYDFTVAASQAFGSNQREMRDNNFALWSGDVSDGVTTGSQDGTVDSNDYSEIENASQQFIFYYHPDDVTGDNQVESADYSLIENNSQLFLFLSRP